VREGLPPYLNWFGSAAFERELAQGALTLAAATSRNSRSLVESAEAILDRTTIDASITPREAVENAAWLARAHLATGDLDRAVPAGLTALRRLPTVHSRGCALVLRRLKTISPPCPPPTARPPPAPCKTGSAPPTPPD
jgi:hypothetical protein